MSRLIIVAALPLALFPVMLIAKDQPVRERGVLAEMQSVSCGTIQKTGSTVAGVLITGAQHTKSRELLCQEYVLKSDRVTYRIRPKEEKHPVLLRVGDEAEFRLKKDEMLLRVPESDNKEREYIVLSMIASPELTADINKTQHPPKPHGKKLEVSSRANIEEEPSSPETVAQPVDPPLQASSQSPSPVSTTTSQTALKIDSTPAGAEIFIDSVDAGHTPALIPVKPGQHIVQIVLSGYVDWVGTVNAAAGTHQQVTANLAK